MHKYLIMLKKSLSNLVGQASLLERTNCMTYFSK